MGAIGLDLKFLDHIEVDSPLVKAIRLNDDEMYMLKFIKYKGMKFSSYVKQLIIADIRNYCNKDSAAVASISKDDMKEMILEALRENNYTKKEREVHQDEDEAITALGLMGISKRIS